jgi:hypothetical protein
MKMTAQNPSKPAEQPVFHKVAENLYRLESSGRYYALIKKSGKQFRRSLKTKDRKLADRRLKELKGQIGCLTLTDDAKLGFEAVANRWLEASNTRWLPARSFNGKSASRISPRFSKAFRCETSPCTM